MSAPRLAMRGITQRFGATLALDAVDLAVGPGEIHAVVGENGAGKSTLMKVLAGALVPQAGTLELEGVPYAPRSPADARWLGVGMIYQELALAPHLGVAENVLLGIEPRRGWLVDRTALRERARAALSAVGHAELDLDQPVARLSIAERQLVEIARAVASGCRVLVLDEPTSSLAAADIERLFALLRSLARSGTSILYVSHALEEVFALCERWSVLRDGRRVASGAIGDTSGAALIALMVGRELSELYPRTPRQVGACVVELDHLAGVRLPHTASLALHHGEVLGIYGLVGAGRTELLRALFGLDVVKSGAIRVHALHGPRSPAERWTQGAGFVSEDRKREGLALSLSVADNLLLASLTKRGIAALVPPAQRTQLARPWIEMLGVRCRHPAQTLGELSGGNQQKVALARLLATGADIYLLDEPTRGIDVGSKAAIYALIDRLACGTDASQPKAVLIVSSYIPELVGICDRIAVMRKGELGPARPVVEWSEERLLAEATRVSA